MRWPWTKKPKLPDIPPHRIELDFKPLTPRDVNYVVEEKEMTETGMWRIFPWTKKDQPKD